MDKTKIHLSDEEGHHLFQALPELKLSTGLSVIIGGRSSGKSYTLDKIYNMCEGEECPGCGKKTLIWKQSEFGTPHLECTECAYAIGVDLNTPCELDPAFSKKIMIAIEPQSELPATVR